MRDTAPIRTDSPDTGPAADPAAAAQSTQDSGSPRSSGAGSGEAQDAILDLIPIVRRVIAARVRDQQIVDDLVQETLARMMVARGRLDADALVPYAVAIGRNLVIATGQGEDRARRKAHLLTAATESDDRPPDDAVFRREEISVIGTALARLAPAERDVLLAHEVEGTGTARIGRGPRIQSGRDRRPVEPDQGQVAGGVPAGGPEGGTADRPVPSGAVRAVGGRPATATRIGRRRASADLR